jgi:hypothetical protein
VLVFGLIIGISIISSIESANNDDHNYGVGVAASNVSEYIGAISGERIPVQNGHIYINIQPNSGDVWVPNIDSSFTMKTKECQKVQIEEKKVEENVVVPQVCEEVNVEIKEEKETISNIEIKKEEVVQYDESFEKGRIAGLQEAVLARMEKNGYVTEQMKKDVYNQTHIPSLINWIKSF